MKCRFCIMANKKQPQHFILVIHLPLMCLNTTVQTIGATQCGVLHHYAALVQFIFYLLHGITGSKHILQSKA